MPDKLRALVEAEGVPMCPNGQPAECECLACRLVAEISAAYDQQPAKAEKDFSAQEPPAGELINLNAMADDALRERGEPVCDDCKYVWKQCSAHTSPPSSPPAQEPERTIHKDWGRGSSGPVVCHRCWGLKENHNEPCIHVREAIRAAKENASPPGSQFVGEVHVKALRQWVAIAADWIEHEIGHVPTEANEGYTVPEALVKSGKALLLRIPDATQPSPPNSPPSSPIQDNTPDGVPREALERIAGRWGAHHIHPQDYLACDCPLCIARAALAVRSPAPGGSDPQGEGTYLKIGSGNPWTCGKCESGSIPIPWEEGAYKPCGCDGPSCDRCNGWKPPGCPCNALDCSTQQPPTQEG